MAFYNSKTLLALLLVFSILLASTDHTIARRNTLERSKNADKKQPQFLVDKDGSFLVPGIGRFMFPKKGHGFPKKGHGFNPHTYNPITGTSGGSAAGGGSSSSGTGGGHSYVPGGDDTLVPNPGVEVPTGGGSHSAPASP
ncbi:hypothetical protein RHSIM_Rhsim06G0148800 [Rhododendron simsii]|uniref:Cell wall protein n=1 Tax=Rhododendron simsii TaxID=118357 RepID=A0A834LLB8_RHOSS|nr:hypothetical protein RHSIM_Rhsim06G0148800 [Rhododendron simsii]